MCSPNCKTCHHVNGCTDCIAGYRYPPNCQNGETNYYSYYFGIYVNYSEQLFQCYYKVCYRLILLPDIHATMESLHGTPISLLHNVILYFSLLQYALLEVLVLDVHLRVRQTVKPVTM